MFAYNGKNQVETLWERFNLFKAEQADKFSDDGGSGPLLRDALSNHTALVDILLKSGADTKLKDKEGHVAKDFDYHPDADSEILDKVVKKEASKEESRDEL
jgi:ankyrin repeat protein